jgi:hypothetical protein
MNIISIQNVAFDDGATSAMGEAFDRACKVVRRYGPTVREMIAKRIIDAAKNGERNPIRLQEQALIPFGFEDMSVLVVSVDWECRLPAYASVTHAAQEKRDGAWNDWPAQQIEELQFHAQKTG